jgi:hypothetical protein
VGRGSWFLQQGLLEKVFNRTLLLDRLCHLQVTLDSSFLVSQKRSTCNHTVTFLVVSFVCFAFVPSTWVHPTLGFGLGRGGGRLRQEQAVPAGKAKVIHLFVIKSGPPGGSFLWTTCVEQRVPEGKRLVREYSVLFSCQRHFSSHQGTVGLLGGWDVLSLCNLSGSWHPRDVIASLLPLH